MSLQDCVNECNKDATCKHIGVAKCGQDPGQVNCKCYAVYDVDIVGTTSGAYMSPKKP